MRPRRRRPAGESGSVTAELALALPTLILILVIAVWMQSAVALSARCQDAARAGARAAARGDPDATIRGALAGVLPAGTQVDIRRSAGHVTVSVRASVPVPGGLSSLVAAPAVTGSATAIAEQDP